MDEAITADIDKKEIDRSKRILDEIVQWYGINPDERFLNLDPQQETELVERWAERASRGIPELLYSRGADDQRKVDAFRHFLGILKKKPVLQDIFIADANRQFRERNGSEFNWENNNVDYIDSCHDRWREEDREDGLIEEG